MKTKEELNALKKETEELKGKLAELNDEELEQVSGGRRDGSFSILHEGLVHTGSVETDNDFLGEDPPMGFKSGVKMICPLCTKIYTGSETQCTEPACCGAQLEPYEV